MKMSRREPEREGRRNVSIEQSKALARRWIDEIWRKRNLDAIDELIAEDAVLHGSSPEPLVGPAAARHSVETMLEAFPDSQVDIVHLVAEENLVAVHFRATGTHRGDFQGIQPTGNKIDTIGMSIMKVENGQVVEEWQLFDQLGVLQQLGAMPS